MGKSWLHDSIYGRQLKDSKNKIHLDSKSMPAGTTKIPPTYMDTIDNQMTSMPNGDIVPQKRQLRLAKYQANGRFYHKPWPKNGK